MRDENRAYQLTEFIGTPFISPSISRDSVCKKSCTTKIRNPDLDVLKRIHMTDEVYIRMDRGSTRQKSYELSISDKPYKDKANFAPSGTYYSPIQETCDPF